MNVVSEKDGRSISVREYKRVVGEHGKMVSMTQKGRKSMYNMKESPRNEQMEVLVQEFDTDGQGECF